MSLRKARDLLQRFQKPLFVESLLLARLVGSSETPQPVERHDLPRLGVLWRKDAVSRCTVEQKDGRADRHGTERETRGAHFRFVSAENGAVNGR